MGTLVPDEVSEGFGLVGRITVGDGWGLVIPLPGADVTSSAEVGAKVEVTFLGVAVSFPISSKNGGIEDEGPLTLDGAAVSVSVVVVICGEPEGAGDTIVPVVEVGDAVEHSILPKHVMPPGHVPLGHGVALAHCVAAES